MRPFLLAQPTTLPVLQLGNTPYGQTNSRRELLGPSHLDRGPPLGLRTLMKPRLTRSRPAGAVLCFHHVSTDTFRLFPLLAPLLYQLTE